MADPWKRKEVIGDCTLYLGDCLEVMPALGQFDAVVTDPPYEDELHAKMGRFAKLRKDGVSYPSVIDGSLPFAGVNDAREDIARICVEASKGWVVLFTLAEGVRAWRDALQSYGAKYDTCLAWIKPDSAPRFNGQGAARGFECAVTAWAGRGHKRWNGGGKRGVYTHCVNVGRHGGHPTEKPVPLMSELLQDFAPLNGNILDPFMGSGTTMVSCANRGLRGVGVEQNQEYFELACKRVRDAYSQPDFFIAPPAKPIQEVLL